ncbi:Uncharacterised protein [Bordetella pertussis]|nr:Uncharacterised protein [Bordetella pertussis]CFW05804.1 Uncharacterised protein [Bordetella pertussis]CFW34040.1 Uncharacterised protein [Bordetella pertussis]
MSFSAIRPMKPTTCAAASPCGYSRTQRARSSTPGNSNECAENQAASVSLRLLRSCRLA